jgi:hypothetical protein
MISFRLGSFTDIHAPCLSLPMSGKPCTKRPLQLYRHRCRFTARGYSVDRNREFHMAEKLTRRLRDTWLKSDVDAWLWCGEQRGFGAQRRQNGRAAFVVQFRVGRGRLAKRRRVVLGEYPAMSPEPARERAVEHISAGWSGIDPVAERREGRPHRPGNAIRLGVLPNPFSPRDEAI